MRLKTYEVALAAALSLAMGTAQAAPVKLRVGWVVVPPELPPILFAEPGVARHLGQSYTMEATRFGSSAPMITALSADELEITPLTFFTTAAAIENAGLHDLRIIADEFQDGHPGYFTGRYMVRKDSGINRIEDLKGKAVAAFGIGSLGDVLARDVLLKHGLEEGRDYTYLQVAPPNLKAMLAGGKVDLISAQGIIYYDPELQAIARPLFAYKDALGPTEAAVFVARAGFLAKNRAAVVDFLEDYLRAIRWYDAPANHAAAVAILANATKRPAAQLDWAFTTRDEYRDPNGLPDLDALQREIDAARQFGLLKEPLDIKKYADLSYVEEAAKRLK